MNHPPTCGNPDCSLPIGPDFVVLSSTTHVRYFCDVSCLTESWFTKLVNDATDEGLESPEFIRLTRAWLREVNSYTHLAERVWNTVRIFTRRAPR